MIDRKIIKFQLRRGTDQQRMQVVFDEAELIYTTDTREAYVGDGVTPGGVPLVDINNSTALSADSLTLRHATLSTFSNPVTASGTFLVMSINQAKYGLRLWNVPTI